MLDTIFVRRNNDTGEFSDNISILPVFERLPAQRIQSVHRIS